MQLNLKNPVVFFDLETTGTRVDSDRIVEISLLKVNPDGTEKSKTYLVNPTIPIPKEASDIHHITDEKVKDAPIFKEVGQRIADFLSGCDLAGFNSGRFDIPLLAEEFLRADIDIDLKKKKHVDVQVIFHKMEPRTLSAAYQFYCQKDLTDAHSAEADTRATYEVLKAQLERYESSNEIKNDMEVLSKLSSYGKNVDFAGRLVYDKSNEPTFNFGKYKGKKVKEILAADPGYYGWMMGSNFPLHTKKVLTQIKLGQI